MRGVSIFRLRTVEQVGQICGWVEAGYETHRVPSYDLDTPSDALDQWPDNLNRFAKYFDFHIYIRFSILPIKILTIRFSPEMRKKKKKKKKKNN